MKKNKDSVDLVLKTYLDLNKGFDSASEYVTHLRRKKNQPDPRRKYVLPDLKSKYVLPKELDLLKKHRVLGVNQAIYCTENINNRASVTNAVLQMLNKSGGAVLCLNNDVPFDKPEEASAAGDDIGKYLQKVIFNFPRQKVKIETIGEGGRYFVVIKVEKGSNIYAPRHSLMAYSLLKDHSGHLSKYYKTIRKNKVQGSFEINENDDKKTPNQSLKEYAKSIKDITFSGIRKIEKYLDGYYKVGEFAAGSKFYKYMSLENALQCFIGSNIWFVEPTNWKDQFENFFYGATLFGEKYSKNNPLLYATCMTNKRDSESAWKIYSYNQKGWAALCVELMINKNEFRKQLRNARVKKADSKRYKQLSTDYDVYEGVVEYKDEEYILNLTRAKNLKSGLQNIGYKTYFKDFTFEKYLNLMLMKRDAFQHESEIRFFIVPKKWNKYPKDHSHLIVKMDWSKVLEGVRYDVNFSKFEKEMLYAELKKVLKLKKTDSLPVGFRFEPYDVYDGPEPPVF